MREKCTNKKKMFSLLLVFLLLFSNFTVFAAKPDKTAPTAPSNLRVTYVTDTSVSIAWSASYDKSGVKEYLVYRDNGLVGTVAGTSITISGLLPEQTYNFFVKAKDLAGNISASSNVLTVTTAKTTVTVPETTTAPTETTTQQTTTSQPVTTTTQTTTATTTTTTSSSKIVGYYAAWSAYSGFTPDKVDAGKVTYLNYAFANIGSDLKIAMGYPDIDPTNFTKLKALKQSNPNLKTIIAVGGWSWSGRFSDVALTDASRTAFADSCVDFIVTNGFDGIDIDWEYPVSGGVSTNVRRPEDKTNFTLLMQKLREKLDARGQVDGKHYILSFAGAISTGYVNNIELSNLRNYVDYANVMTYDIHGSWDTYTDFNAPLYANGDVTSQFKWSVDQGIKTWLYAGFPADKMIMGIPFYGYMYKAVTNANNGLYQTYSGCSSISYVNIAGNYLNDPSYVRHYQSESMVPWLFNGTNFITYEDEQSVTLKAGYIKSNGLGGAMVWELSQDPNRVLLTALYNGLK